MESPDFLLGTLTPDASTATPSPSATTPGPNAPVPLPARAPDLVVGHAEDAAELDADRRADAALGRLARRSADTGQPRRSPASSTPAVGYDGGPVPDDVAGRIERLRGAGEPLPAATRARMEQGFGASFSGVRLHVGDEPARLNRLVSAEAFTVGRDVFFGAGRFDPDSPNGERVLAHELAHTLQPATAVRRKPAALAVTPAATNADLAVGDQEWLALRTATLAYSVLAEDQYDDRAAQLGEISKLMDTWVEVARTSGKVVRKRSQAELDQQLARVNATKSLRELVAVEQRELADAGVRANERTQKIKGPRFKGDYLLEQVMGGSAALKIGDRGLYVTKIQQALADLNWLEGKDVTGTFAAETEAGLKVFQKAANLPESGRIDKATVAKLDSVFTTHGVEARLSKALAAPVRTGPGEYPPDTAPDELYVGTRTLGDDNAAAAREAVKTRQPAGPGGVEPTFVADIPNVGTYKQRLTLLVDHLVMGEYEDFGKGRAGKRAETDLLSWPHLEKVAERAKAATDGVFGKYAVGPPLKKGAGLHDAWDQKVTMQGVSPEAARLAAARRVTKILVGDSKVRELDKRHGAIQSRPAEQAIVNEVRLSIMASRRTELLETDKGWPGFSEAGQISLQLFKADDIQGNRTKMWDLFQTIVHEYLHTLEHSLHKTYREKLKQQEGSMTLREGVVDYLTFTVLESLTWTPELRKIVEGEFHDEAVEHPIPRYEGYSERVQAEKLAGIVGARNVMAAFFLGDVAKIGKAP